MLLIIRPNCFYDILTTLYLSIYPLYLLKQAKEDDFMAIFLWQQAFIHQNNATFTIKYKEIV